MGQVGKFLVEKVQPPVTRFLGVDDEAQLARDDARNAALERENMAKINADSDLLEDNPNMNQEAFEDTLSHILAGAYTTSESGLDLGKRVANILLNPREQATDKGIERDIDINNNNVGKVLAQFRISEAGGGLRGDALQEQLLEDAKMLAAVVSPFSVTADKAVREYLYNKKDGLMHQLDLFITGNNDRYNRILETPFPKLSTKGRKLTNEEIKEQLSGMNKGGMMDNQTVKAFAIGGEAIDPISGNEVPEGSFPNEVRDDVPAMLSEGEYVVPADVLRFYGLKFFEDLRENAKIEIARMSQEGRIGGEPVEEPESLNDEDVVVLERMVRNANNGSKGDVVEMAKGGLIDKFANTIKMNPGGLVSSNLYSDPTKVDAIIKEVSIAAKDNPELFKRLASKGVVLDKTNANMKPEEMLEENKPMFNLETGEEIVKANEGGLMGYNTAGMVFNPNKLFYGNLNNLRPKISTGSFINEAGETITVNYETINGIQMITGYTRDNDPQKRVFPIPIPEGFTKIERPPTELDNLELTETQPDKEFGGEYDLLGMPDQDMVSGNANSLADANISGAQLATGQREPTFLEKIFMKTPAYKMMVKAQFKAAGIPQTDNEEIDRLNLSIHNLRNSTKYLDPKSTKYKEVGKQLARTENSLLNNPNNPASATKRSQLKDAYKDYNPYGTTAASKAKTPSSNQGNPASTDNVNFSQGPPGFGDTAADKDKTFGMDEFNMNKGGLAVKKSKPIKKKMNTGGLVQKKKKKNSK